MPALADGDFVQNIILDYQGNCRRAPCSWLAALALQAGFFSNFSIPADLAALGRSPRLNFLADIFMID
jgi:hypothetical protein